MCLVTETTTASYSVAFAWCDDARVIGAIGVRKAAKMSFQTVFSHESFMQYFLDYYFSVKLRETFRTKNET